MTDTVSDAEGLQPCPVCGSVEECPHYLIWDDFFSEYADGIPASLAARVAAVEEQEGVILATAPQHLQTLFTRAAPDAYDDINAAYWTTEPGVIERFFDAGFPGAAVRPSFTRIVQHLPSVSVARLRKGLSG